MANPTPVARISAIQGQAFAKGKDGALRVLHVGDLIFEADVLVAAADSRVDLATGDGRTLIMRANETLTVDAEVAASVQPDMTDSAVLAVGADVSTVIKAIAQGSSLDDLLEDPAAGDNAGSSDGGASFVRLLRIAETIDPQNFDFDAARRAAVDENQGVGNDIAANAAGGSTSVGADTGATENAPTITLTGHAVTEGAVSTATVVATFSGADADAGDTLSYTLLNDPDGYFQIVGSEVRLTTAGVAAVDNDALNLTQLPGITVQVSDGIHTASASDIADITRINDSVPTLSVLAQDITEGAVSTATVVATFSGADADAGDTLSYTLLNDPDGYFQIVGSEVRLTAAGVAAVDNDALNLTQLPAITVQVSDGIHTASASDVADITRINDSVPTLSVLAQDVTEGSVSTTTVVATFSGADADAGDTLSYTLLNDPDGYFQIVGNEVRLTAAGVAAVDNDALNLTQLPAITIQVSDGIHAASASDVADITRINDSVPTLSVLAQDVTEGAVSTATVVATFSGADADAGDTLSYTLLNDPDGYFQIVGTEVRLTAAGVAAVDNDALNLTQLPGITVQVSDGIHTASASDVADITRINDSVPTLSVLAQDITEGTVSTATVVATFSGADADAGDTLSYTLLNDPDGYFQIVGTEVRLTAAGVAAVDNDALNLTQLPAITIQVSDGIHTASASDVSDITRINDSVPTLFVSANDVTEGAVSTATVVATFSGADADAGDTLSYTLLNDPDGYFQIIGSEVRLTAAGVAAVDNDALNLTQLPAITVQVSDGIHTASASDVSDITRINDSVPTLFVSANDVTEGAVSTATVVATFSGADADAGDTLSYTLLNDTDGYFQIVGSEVRLTAAGVAAVDNDALNLTQLPAITVQVSDGVHTASASDIADITRINDSAPTLSVLAQDVTEGAVSTATVVATFSGADADAGDTLSYTLLNDTDGYFQIVGSEVRLTAAGVAAVDNDALNLTQLPAITVQVSDAAGHTASASDVADITRINDSVPTLSVLAQDVTEGAVSTATAVATFSGADADAGDTLSYTLFNDPDGYFQIVGSEVRLTAAGVAAVDNDALNLTQLPVITVQVSDAAGHTASASDTSDITRINDSVPTLTISANDIIEGAVSTATVVATFSGADADAGDTLSYTLLNDPDGYFQIVGSEVRLTAAGVAAVDNDALNLTQLPAITVQVSDGVHTASASDIADITRINDSAPTLSVLAQDVTEGAVSTATVVATFSGADADVGDTLSYMLLNDPDGYFQIVGSEVRLTAAGVAAVDNDALNLTQLPAITVQVSDVAGHTASASDIADITRINDSAPTLSVLAQDVTEGAVSTATVVAIFSGADADAGDTLSYMLLNDPDGYFQIVGSEVRLTAAGVAAVDNDALNLTQLPVITVQVSDAAGHTASASDTSDITRINGAPSGADKMITISEDSSFVLSAADFGFSDTDTPANAFASVFITSLPDTGSLTLNGVLLTPGASVSAASISSGDLVFTPVGNASGHAYANFSFQVVDDGGTANGGQNTDLSANRITFDVTPVADAPTLTLSASQTFSSTTFDDFGLPSAQNWGGVSIPASSGWKTDNPGGLVEIGYENVYVSAGSATNRVIELEANTGDASNLYTDINTMLGAQYHLAFDYSARSGNELNSNINIYWAGHLLGVLNANTAGFAHFDFVIVGDGNPDRLEFRAMDSNSLGGLLDNISLQQADNIGYQGNTIALGGIVADLVDTDGSESLALHVGNIVAGSVIGDGAHTQTVGVDGVADITGWNYNSLALTPPASYRGTMTLDVQAIATEGDNLSTATKHASLAVVVLNNVPVAVADAFTTPEDTAISLLPAQLLANDGDVDGDTLSIASVQGATHGSVALVGGNVVFTPNANYNGPASFTYIVSDGHGGSSTATASLNVTPVNDGPVAAADFAAVTEAGVTPNNTPFAGTPSAIGNVLTNDTDVDSGDAKIVSAVNGLAGNVGSVLAGVYGTLTLAANGAYTYTLDNADPDTQALAQGAIPTETFTYTLRDAAGLTSSNTLTVTINGSNDAPLAVDDIVITNIAAGQAIPIPSSALLVNDSDPDSGANLSLSSVSSAQNGTVLGTNPVVFTDTTSFGTSAKIVAEAALYPGDSETQGLNNTQALAYEIGRSQFGQVSAADAPYVGNAALPSFKWTGRVDDVFGTPAVTDQDYLKVYLYAGEKIILDIDGGDSGLTTIGTDPNAVDMLLKLYNANGVELAQNDDAVNTLGGLGSVKSGYHGNSLDSYLEYTVAADGYYYIDATAFNNNANGINQDDGNYQLWVSIQPTLVAHPSSFDYKLSDGLVNDSGHVSVTTVQGSLITGGNAGEILIGGGGNDTLNSAAGDDVLIGGAGNDIMSGGLGADVFQWNFADRGAAGVPAVDTITDFSVSNSAASKDVLDLRDLLQGEHAVSSGLNNFLHFEKSGADTIVHVSSSGGFNADSHIVGSTFTNAAETQRIVLQSADLVGSNTLDQQIIQDLLSKGKLVTD